MAVRPKLMIGAGLAIAGLGLVGAGAGATFTAQVSADTTITSGGIGLSLNGETGSDVDLEVDGRSISSHFTPISKDLVLKNTGTVNMASTFLRVTATGCDGGASQPLAEALHVRLTDETNDDLIYDGTLCSLVHTVSSPGAATRTTAPGASGNAAPGSATAGRPGAAANGGPATGSRSAQGFAIPAEHTGVGGQLPRALRDGATIRYRVVIRPDDEVEGLPSDAQFTRTSVKLVFTGYDF